MSKRCAFAWSPKVLRAGQGAHFCLDIFEDADLVEWAARYRAEDGEIIALVAAGGTSLYDARLTRRIAIAVGNEGAGLDPALAAASTQQVTIPMPGGMESLNAAVAAAVCLFECVRRRVARPA
jgi:TrmH family RNA methyltransferase